MVAYEIRGSIAVETSHRTQWVVVADSIRRRPKSPASYVTTQPGMLCGQPCFRGLRVSLTRLDSLIYHYPRSATDAILSDYRFIESSDLKLLRKLLHDVRGELPSPPRPRYAREYSQTPPAVHAHPELSGFLLDLCVPPAATAILCSRGVFAVHAAEAGLASSLDDEILQYARNNRLALVSYASDMEAALKPGEDAPVVLLNGHYFASDDTAEILHRFLGYFATARSEGAVTSVKRRSVEVWRPVPAEG